MKRLQGPHPMPTLEDYAVFYYEFFNQYVGRNRFSGAASEWYRHLSARITAGDEISTAVAAVGAFHLCKRNRADARHRILRIRALRLYQDSTSSLRKQIETAPLVQNFLSMLSTAFLLGICEVRILTIVL